MHIGWKADEEDGCNCKVGYAYWWKAYGEDGMCSAYANISHTLITLRTTPDKVLAYAEYIRFTPRSAYASVVPIQAEVFFTPADLIPPKKSAELLPTFPHLGLSSLIPMQWPETIHAYTYKHTCILYHNPTLRTCTFLASDLPRPALVQEACCNRSYSLAPS